MTTKFEQGMLAARMITARPAGLCNQCAPGSPCADCVKRLSTAAWDLARRWVVPGRAAYPFFNAHVQAVCFQCDGPLRDHRTSGNAPMRGQFRAHCPKCDATTWYDCAEGGSELVDLNEKTHRSELEASILRVTQDL